MATWSSQQITYGTAFLDTLVAALKTAPTNPLVNTAKIRLSMDPAFAPQPGSTIASLTPEEANFSGYTAGGVACVLSTPVVLSSTCVGTIAEATFTATVVVPFVSAVITGYWIDDGTNVIAAEAFPPGQTANFSNPGAFLALIVQLPIQAIEVTR